MNLTKKPDPLIVVEPASLTDTRFAWLLLEPDLVRLRRDHVLTVRLAPVQAVARCDTDASVAISGRQRHQLNWIIQHDRIAVNAGSVPAAGGVTFQHDTEARGPRAAPAIRFRPGTNVSLFSEGAVEPIKTFSIGYEGENPSYENELHYARQMSDRLNADHPLRSFARERGV